MISVLLDSSDRNLSIGIMKDDTLIDYVCYEAWQRQSEMMISELEKLLKRNDVKRQDIKKVVCGIGPGSYTGVRISLTIAKTMAMALNIPLYPVSSLRILKKDDKPSICVINARSGRSYVGVYEGNKVILEDKIMKNEELLSYIKEHPYYQLCGSVEYLKMQGTNSNVLEQMASLTKCLVATPNHLGLKPIYMKD